MRKHKITTALVSITLISLLLTACQEAVPSSQASTSLPDATSVDKTDSSVVTPEPKAAPQKEELQVAVTEPIISGTYHYDGGFFSIDLPNDWVLDPFGAFISFGFRAYDPNNPNRQIFYYGKQELLLKSQEEKETRQNLADLAGENEMMGYHMFADAPVLETPTTACFFSIYSDYVDYVHKYGITHEMTRMDNFNLIETFQETESLVPTCLDNQIVRATFDSADGTRCQGLLTGQIIDYFSDTYTIPGVDLGYYVVYSSCGVVAPEDEFPELEATLAQCLSSFTISNSYAQQTSQNINNQTEKILAENRSTQEVYDSYNSAWSNRQTSYDVTSQKYSDATLGYDRLYDPDTGEVYRAETGFYDSYNLNRESYDKSNLQIIDDNSEQYYLNSVDYYIQN